MALGREVIHPSRRAAPILRLGPWGPSRAVSGIGAHRTSRTSQPVPGACTRPWAWLRCRAAAPGHGRGAHRPRRAAHRPCRTRGAHRTRRRSHVWLRPWHQHGPPRSWKSPLPPSGARALSAGSVAVRGAAATGSGRPSREPLRRRRTRRHGGGDAGPHPSAVVSRRCRPTTASPPEGERYDP